MPRVQLPAVTLKRKVWNKGRIIGQKQPLLPKQVWAIQARLELASNLRDLALFNVSIDSKLRGCDLVKTTVSDLVKKERVREGLCFSPSLKRSFGFCAVAIGGVVITDELCFSCACSKLKITAGV